jgi:predicted N-formylglutamate amidohydrolase
MPEDPKVYEVLNQESLNPLILTCEHASSVIPQAYHNLGLTEDLLDTHIARDKGCKELTVKLAEKLNCTAFLAGYSRLFIDYNRRENEDSLILDESDKVIIPRNQNLTDKERKYRIENYHRPYYKAIFQKIEHLQEQGITPKIFSIHGFTPQLKGGTYRPWHAGILYVKENPLALELLNGLKRYSELKTDANVPYDLRQYNTGASAICGEDIGLENAVIEIRDTEFDDITHGADKWANILADILEK